MYNYKSNTSAEWLRARRGVITATECVSLLPALKKYKKTAINQPKTIGLVGSKLDTSEPDTQSFGAAARGHILEPYAVAQFNADGYTDCEFFHWDDCIITHKSQPIGFSPDAMSIAQPDNCPVEIESDESTQPYSILEIKSYGAEHHIQSCMTPPPSIPERYQIAAAMVADGAIKDGWVYFYNPSVPQLHGMAYHYDRAALAEEIGEIEDVVDMFAECYKAVCAVGCNPKQLIADEAEIYQQVCKAANTPQHIVENATTS